MPRKGGKGLASIKDSVDVTQKLYEKDKKKD